jgi:hypothetical protein
MKKTGWILVLALATVTAFAQQPSSGAVTPDSATNAVTFPLEKMKQPTYADLHCAGFMSKQLLPNANYVAGGLGTPMVSRFVLGDIVYLAGGGYQPGQQFEVLRELKDVNEFEAYPGMIATVKATGQMYSQLGRLRILDTRNHMAVAQVEYSCEPMSPGDLLAPFTEKPALPLRESGRLDRYAPANGKTTGKIVLARDFDIILGSGSKVYLNVGSNQGVKVGDYVRAMRPYSNDLHDPADSISFRASMVEDSQRKGASLEPGFMNLNKAGSGPVIHAADFPPRAVGELIVLSVTPTTSTAMVIFALDEVHLGDLAEMQ